MSILECAFVYVLSQLMLTIIGIVSVAALLIILAYKDKR